MSEEKGTKSQDEKRIKSEKKGAKIFKTVCSKCHTVEESAPRTIGPSLYGSFGRQAGQVEGFSYSSAMKNSDINWGEESLFGFLEKPKKYVKGTKMVFEGLKEKKDRRNIIAYLKATCSPTKEDKKENLVPKKDPADSV